MYKMKYKHSVLFVDDQRETLELINKIFSEEKFNRFFASSAKEALEILKFEFIDVIITDIYMPDMTGLNLLRIVKEKHPNVVRIVLSSCLQVSFILDAVNNGDIFRYITKPWKVSDESKQIIQEALAYSDKLKTLESLAKKSCKI